MGRDSSEPSEREWQIMEIVWQEGDGVTSADIVRLLKGRTDMTERTIRVLLSRLCGKGLLSYTVDAEDSRVYHYRAARDRAACLEEKRKRFVSHYFGGSDAGAIAAFIDSGQLSEEQIRDLEALLLDKSTQSSGEGVTRLERGGRRHG